MPHAAAQPLVGVAGFGELILLSLDIAVHVSARGVFRRPDTDCILRYCIERPKQLASLGIVGLHKAPDAVFAAVRPNQNLILDHRWSHRLAVSELRIRDVALPGDIAGFCVQCHKLGIKRGEVDEVAEHLDTAVIGTTAIGRHRSHLVLVVPNFCASLRVEGVNMTERRRHIHDAV